jgi:hypothetical protein
MAATKTRGIKKTKKHQPILWVEPAIDPFSFGNQSADSFRFGNRILNIRVGPHNRIFSAHEDLLCSRSSYLKTKIQKARKDIEGECAICHEDLSSRTKLITWCKECGQNLHQACMQQWMEKNKICPMCRAPWVKTPLLQNVVLGELNAEAFDVYVQWLYSHSIPAYEADGDINARCVRLIRAHVLSDNLQDTLFQQAVRRELIDEAQHLDATIIAFAYKHTSGPCPLRRLLVDLYALQGNNDWFLDNSLPRIILTDLAQSLLDKVKLQDGEDVWSFMAAAGHIEEEEAGYGEGAGDESEE